MCLNKENMAIRKMPIENNYTPTYFITKATDYGHPMKAKIKEI